jgi:hypothetical protein
MLHRRTYSETLMKNAYFQFCFLVLSFFLFISLFLLSIVLHAVAYTFVRRQWPADTIRVCGRNEAKVCGREKVK